MTCSTANLLIHLGRTDLAAEDRDALAAHLGNCSDCTTLITRHTAEDAAIAAAMKSVTIPVGFRDALQTQAIAIQSEIWRATWLSRIAAATAAVVALALATGAFSRFTRPNLDSEQLLASFSLGNGASTGIAFEDWRNTEGLPPLPENFDMRLMTFAGRQSLQGVLVPAVRFQAGNSQEAVVYFVRNSKFDLQQATDAIGSNGGVRVYRDQPGWTIIVVHTGTTLTPFLHRPDADA